MGQATTWAPQRTAGMQFQYETQQEPTCRAGYGCYYTGLTVTDPDNVQMTVSYGIQNQRYSGINTYTDTLGAKVLTTNLQGCGGAGYLPLNLATGCNPSGGSDTYTYTDANGNNQTVTVGYQTFTQATAFKCTSPPITDIGPTQVMLPISIQMPTGETFTFSYEPGPNGAVTGRIASLTLPNGGSITYAYSGTSKNGYGTGVNCQDGSVPTLVRTVIDAQGNKSAWKYVTQGSSGSPYYTSLTTVTVVHPIKLDTRGHV